MGSEDATSFPSSGAGSRARFIGTTIILALGAVFFWTAILTFHPFDPSPWTASAHSAPIRNVCGRLGAWLAAVSVFWVGGLALVLPLAFPIRQLLLGIQARRRLLLWFSARIALFLAVAALVSQWLPDLSVRNVAVPPGGFLGRATERVLGEWLGTFGTLGLVLVGIATDVFLFQHRQLPRGGVFWPRLGKTLSFFPLGGGWWLRLRKQPSTASTPQRHAAGGEEGEPSVLDVGKELLPLTRSHILASPRKLEEQRKVGSGATPAALSALFHRSPPPVTDSEEAAATATQLATTLAEFGVEGKVIGYQQGPVVTVFHFKPAKGVKQAKIQSLADDLALALKVRSIFIGALPEKQALGIQVPNSKRSTVTLGDVIHASGATLATAESPLIVAMGVSVDNKPRLADLRAMPHLLIAGSTGSGKSVAINANLCSLLVRSQPSDLRLILVDPKVLELTLYEKVPHLLLPVITEPAVAAGVLEWLVSEMERRYRLLQEAGVRNIDSFNTGPRAKEGERLPYIVLVIDELADLMLTGPREVEVLIQRLSQKSRACGIHLVLATQRPSVDVITGVIKANLPCRLSFQVVSRHDSRTILDQIGAEKLAGKGDALLMRPGTQDLERMQSPLVTDDEVRAVVQSLRSDDGPSYDDEAWQAVLTYAQGKSGGGPETSSDEVDDPLFAQAIEIARRDGAVSASFLQRQLKIGYNRAARIVEGMEAKGLVSKSDGVKPRTWLV